MLSPSLKLSLSRFMTNYGMLFVLLLIVAAFSLATIQEQPVEGRFAGESLASNFAASYDSGTCVVIVSSSVDDERLVEGFRDGMAGDENRIQAIVKGGTPPEIKTALLAALESSGDTKPVAIICSRTTSAYTFFNSIPALSDAEMLVPVAQKRSNFLKPSNLNNVPQKMARMAIIAIGMTMVIITAGIDLSVGSLLALAAVSSTLLVRKFGGVDASATMVLLAFTGGIALCGIMGAVSGILTTAFRMPAFIATLAMMLIARGLAKNMADNQIITGMPSDVFDKLWSFTIPGTSITILSSIVIMITLYAIAHFMMAKTTLGRHIYAIGGNEEAARLSGVPVNRVLLLVYTITGIMAGIAGVMMATEFNSGKAIWGVGLELDVIAAVVVGGTSLMGGQGRILGTLIGCAIIVVIRNGMNLLSLEDSMQMMVMGGVIVLAIVTDKVKKGDIPWLKLSRA
jgi:ribose transport system permease protein